MSMYSRCFVIISRWEKVWHFIWKIFSPFHHQTMIFAKFDWYWFSGVGGEDFFTFVNLYLFFRYYLPSAQSVTLHLNKVDSPSPKNDLCQIWLKLAQTHWKRRNFNFLNMYFLLFRDYLPLKMACLFIWTNLSPHYTKNLCAKFGLNWSAEDGRQAIRISHLSIQLGWVKTIITYCYTNGSYLYWVESRSPKDALC